MEIPTTNLVPDKYFSDSRYKNIPNLHIFNNSDQPVHLVDIRENPINKNRATLGKSGGSRLHCIANWFRDTWQAVKGFFCERCCIPKKQTTSNLDGLRAIVDHHLSAKNQPSSEQANNDNNLIFEEDNNLILKENFRDLDNPSLGKQIKFVQRTFKNDFIEQQDTSNEKLTTISPQNSELTDEEIERNQNFQEFIVENNNAFGRIKTVKNENEKTLLISYFKNLTMRFENLKDLWKKLQREENPNAAQRKYVAVLDWKIWSFVKMANRRHDLLSKLDSIGSEVSKNKKLLDSTQNAGQKIRFLLDSIPERVAENDWQNLLEKYGNNEDRLDQEFQKVERNFNQYEEDIQLLKKYSTEKIYRHESLLKRNKINSALSDRFKRMYEAYLRAQAEIESNFMPPSYNTEEENLANA